MKKPPSIYESLNSDNELKLLAKQMSKNINLYLSSNSYFSLTDFKKAMNNSFCPYYLNAISYLKKNQLIKLSHHGQDQRGKAMNLYTKNGVQPIHHTNFEELIKNRRLDNIQNKNRFKQISKVYQMRNIDPTNQFESKQQYIINNDLEQYIDAKIKTGELRCNCDFEKSLLRSEFLEKYPLYENDAWFKRTANFIKSIKIYAANTNELNGIVNERRSNGNSYIRWNKQVDENASVQLKTTQYITSFTDKELVEELRRRGFTVSATKMIEI